jgi:hypothetical protein
MILPLCTSQLLLEKRLLLKEKKSLSLHGKENSFSKVEKLTTFLEEDLTKGKS